jgi:hypothetical protein
MGELQNPLKERKIEMGLVFELALKGLLLLAEVVAGALLYVHQDSRQTDPFKIGPVFPVERLTTGADKTTDTGAPEPG